ncbi:MAG: nucleotidyltransferase domain-containing protein [Nanobdellota archaeon]
MGAFSDALNILYDRINTDWVIIGSSSLYLQGVEVKPLDIDILSDHAHDIGANLREYEVRPVTYSRAGIFESSFGEYCINGLKVEIMQGLKIRVGDEWMSFAEGVLPKMVDYRGFRVPVLPLENELDAYERMGRPKDQPKIQRIRQYLDSQAPR